MSKELVYYTRAGKVESIHRGNIAAVDVKGNMVFEVGDGRSQMFWRSAAKPFQVLPFVEKGGVARFDITAQEIAMMVSSHSGEAEHVDVVEKLLTKIGMNTDLLACGKARPMNSRAANALICQNTPFQAVHNPCSGKHSGMLALAKLLGVNSEGYTNPEHAVQKLMLAAVADSTKMIIEDVEYGIDGCGVPVFYLPLYNMSLAYARLGKPEEADWGNRQAAVCTIRDAMLACPQIVAGTGRLDAMLMTLTKGRILAKVGAEAVYCMASVPDGIGITFKIEDGSHRAIEPVAIELLRKMDLITIAEYEQLNAKYSRVLKNHRGDEIGTVEVVF